MITFDDPEWRSPLTGSTKVEILVMRATFRTTVTYVNVVMIERYRVADIIRKQELADEAKLVRLEQEERDNAEPITRTA